MLPGQVEVAKTVSRNDFGGCGWTWMGWGCHEKVVCPSCWAFAPVVSPGIRDTEFPFSSRSEPQCVSVR